MKMPKYKSTKWKVKICINCGEVNPYRRCCENHEIGEVDNIPFFVPDMKIIDMGWKGWACLSSDILDRKFRMAPSKLEKIILKTGIEPNGKLSNRWWMWGKIGTSYTLVEIVDEK